VDQEVTLQEAGKPVEDLVDEHISKGDTTDLMTSILLPPATPSPQEQPADHQVPSPTTLIPHVNIREPSSPVLLAANTQTQQPYAGGLGVGVASPEELQEARSRSRASSSFRGVLVPSSLAAPSGDEQQQSVHPQALAQRITELSAGGSSSSMASANPSEESPPPEVDSVRHSVTRIKREFGHKRGGSEVPVSQELMEELMKESEMVKEVQTQEELKTAEEKQEEILADLMAEDEEEEKEKEKEREKKEEEEGEEKEEETPPPTTEMAPREVEEVGEPVILVPDSTQTGPSETQGKPISRKPSIAGVQEGRHPEGASIEVAPEEDNIVEKEPSRLKEEGINEPKTEQPQVAAPVLAPAETQVIEGLLNRCVVSFFFIF